MHAWPNGFQALLSPPFETKCRIWSWKKDSPRCTYTLLRFYFLDRVKRLFYIHQHTHCKATNSTRRLVRGDEGTDGEREIERHFERKTEEEDEGGEGETKTKRILNFYQVARERVPLPPLRQHPALKSAVYTP